MIDRWARSDRVLSFVAAVCLLLIASIVASVVVGVSIHHGKATFVAWWFFISVGALPAPTYAMSVLGKRRDQIEAMASLVDPDAPSNSDWSSTSGPLDGTSGR